MTNQELIDKTKQLYEDFVLADFSDLQNLAQLHMRSEELDKPDIGWQGEMAINAVHALVELIENVILDDVQDAERARETILKTVAALAQAAGNGRESGAVEFPPELFTGSVADSTDDARPETESAGLAIFLENDPSLLGEFVNEANEHLENADAQLLIIEHEPQSEDAVNAVFRAFHTIKGTSSFLALDQIQGVAHVAENLLDKARNREIVLDGSVLDICFDAIDALRGLVAAVSQSLASGNPLEDASDLGPLFTRIEAAVSATTSGLSDQGGNKPLGQILVETGKASPESIETAVETQHQLEGQGELVKLGEVLVQQEVIARKDVAQALRVQKDSAAKVKEPVKVDSDRLDYLVDTIGEMVIAESMVSQAPGWRESVSPDVVQYMNQLDKITNELQQIATSLRMVSVRATFQKMARLVRDLSRKSGKQVKFIMEGEDTELDKSVVDKIGDPLVHMIRNAVDHGLESCGEDRIAAGKGEIGTVRLRAFHEGGTIHIEIEDDGRGLDREAILKKAIERGVVSPNDELTDTEVWSLIFEPGFSTAAVVTDVSGRGVGMDVVRKNIDALRGQVEIRSTKGEGTVFSIHLPLTLAIIDGMVFRVGDERYILPTLSITQSLQPKREALSTAVGRGEMLRLHGKILPIFRVADLFDVRDAIEDPTSAIIVVVEYGGKQAGLLVDELLGQQQTVIKSLGDTLQNVPGVSGGAIMPDGNIGLIVDVAGLVELAHNSDRAKGAGSTKADQELALQGA